jgi:predicted dehydrogenase
MRAAVVGAGQISRQHLACLKQLPGIDIAAVCDLSPVAAEAAADRFKVGAWYCDHRAMLREIKPDVVHVTTPPSSHFRLAGDALDAAANVILEKPATLHYAQTIELLEKARGRGVVLIEDYNYLFNSQVQHILSLIQSGAFGSVVHVDVFLSLHILGPDSPFADGNVRHPLLEMEGGAIADFLPHLASLAHAFVGEHHRVESIWMKRSQEHPLPSDEFRALVQAERGTAMLGFSAHAQPDAFSLRVDGTRMRASANLFETRLTFERLRTIKPLMPLLNGIEEARTTSGQAFSSMWRKLSGGPGAYHGLWELLRRTYAALDARTDPPITLEQIGAVNRLVRDLTKEASNS